MALKQAGAAEAPIETGAETERAPFLVRWAGAALVVAALFAMAAVMALGSFGVRSPLGWAFGACAVVGWLLWWAGRRAAQRLAPDALARDGYARQRAMLGANAFSSVLLLALLLVGINYLAARRHRVFDLTGNRINSLAPQTQQALQQLPAAVKLTYIFVPRDRSGQPPSTAVALLNAYKNASDKVQVEYLNAYAEPLRFQNLKLTASGRQLPEGQTLLLAELEKSANRATARQEIAVMDEQNVTSALLRLANPQPRVLYFLTGHGEATPGDARAGLAWMKVALEAQNYTLKTVSLANAKAPIPKDAAAVIAFAPQTDLTAPEEKTLRSYAASGHLAIFLTPARGPQTRWKSLLRSLGVQWLDGIVLDFQQFVDSPQVVRGVLGDATRHPLLRGVSGDVVFPGGTLPLQATGTVSGDLTSLFESSGQSVREIAGPRRSQQPGPFALAFAHSGEGEARTLVVGNAYFCTDQAYELLGNGSFLLAGVNWTAGADKAIAIPPKPPVTNTITLTDSGRRFVSLFSLFLLPVGVLLLGAIVWWRRR